jgi:adenylate cyclase
MKLFTNKKTHFFVLLLLLFAATYFSGSNHDLRKRLQYATFDTYNKLKPREKSDRVAIVDLDEESLRKLGQWPWPRKIMGDLVLSLKEMGASVIAFDIVFPEPDRTSPSRIAAGLPGTADYEAVRTALQALPDNDALFAEAIKEAGNVVMGFTRARADETLRFPYQPVEPTFLLKDKTPFFKNTFAVEGVAENLPEFSKAAAGNGSFMATPDIDGIIRQVSLFVRYPQAKLAGIEPKLYPMLGIEALRVADDPAAKILLREKKDSERSVFDANYVVKAAGYDIPIESDSRLWVYYRHIAQEEYISAWKILDEAERGKLREKVNGKIVFIGTSAEGLRDIRSTPLDIFVPGVEVHVNIVEQILQKKFLLRPNIIVGVEAVIIGLAGLLIILLAPFLNVIVLGVFTLGLMFFMFLGSWQMYQSVGILLDPVYPSIALSFLFLVSSLLSYVRSEAERRQVRQAFGLYISPAFMNELTKNPDRLKLGGEVRNLTVMFTDIRSFTTISESMSPEELILLMNDFLTPMSDLVMQNRGTIDKYMGDAMMAFWNAPLDDADHARHACLSALEMNRALLPVNEKLKEKAEREGRTAVFLNAGIGINTGLCSVGNMGSRQRFAYSALGDTVNLASRLESQTKAYGVNILAGEKTKDQVADYAFLELDLIRVKGKEKPVRIYTLLGDETMFKDSAFQDVHEMHNAFLSSYRRKEFEKAWNLLSGLEEKAYEAMSGYYKMMQGRIEAFAKTPPPEDWDGVYVAKEK